LKDKNNLENITNILSLDRISFVLSPNINKFQYLNL